MAYATAAVCTACLICQLLSDDCILALNCGTLLFRRSVASSRAACVYIRRSRQGSSTTVDETASQDKRGITQLVREKSSLEPSTQTVP